MTPDLTKYFLYARKSTKDREKQALSIPSQIDVLTKLAKAQNLMVVDCITERETAHVPGRPEFNRMMRRIEAGDANGILAWHPDRLARNSRDGGEIITFLDAGLLTDLKFATFWFENTPQGKSNLGHEFVQTKQYSDKLACDTKRGLRDKALMGHYPSIAPRGYLNDKATKTIALDPHLAPIIKTAFERFAEGDKTLEEMKTFFEANGVLSNKRERGPRNKGGLKIHADIVRRMLRNPFYYGHFEYGGELFEGKHPPIISKALFDKVQGVLERRTHHFPENRDPKSFTGLFRCAECNMAVTAEVQKGHTYYRCTKKSRTRKCSQKFIREEALETQLSTKISEFTLRKDLAEGMLQMAEREDDETTRTSRAFVADKQAELAKLKESLNRLLSLYITQDVDRESYLATKNELLSQKKALREAIDHHEKHGFSCWLEPFTDWVKTAQNLGEIAQKGSAKQKKDVALKIFGSNLFLDSKKARGSCVKPWSFIKENSFPGGMVPRHGLEP